MAQGGSIRYTIGFDIDRKGLESLQKDLVKLQTMTSNDLIAKGFKADSPELKQAIIQMNKAKEAASAIGPALQKSFSTKLNTVNVSTFQKEIVKTYGSVEKLFNELNAMGGEFQQFSTKLASSLLTTNSSLQKTETIIDKMGRSFINTLGWSISSGIVHKITGTIQQAVGYVEHLDTSLNDIRIVTKKSSDEMGEFAKQANNAAKALGKSTTDYTEAALIYYQQGLSDEETAARAETTLKVANVTGQSTAAVSEELTAVWNGYKVSAEEAELYVDKLSAVAATTASDLQELSTGMSKVASAAANMGVDVDQLNAQLATIVSVTRQAPESVGTALKTIYARMTDLQAGGTDEDDIDLGKVSGGLANLGINILDETGDLRELGDVIEEVAESWENWTSAQQAAVAQLIAGKRQYNNIVALFDNWDMYENAIETSRNSMGELQRQQDIYMESTHAHLQQLKAQSEDLYDSLLNANTINTLSDGLSKILKIITDIVDGLGGGLGVLTTIGSLFSGVLSNKLAGGLSNMIGRIDNNKAFQEQLNAQGALAASLQNTEGSTKKLGEFYKSWTEYAGYMTNEQIQQNKNISEQVGLALARKDALAEEAETARKENESLQEQQQEYENIINTIDEVKQERLNAIDEAHNASKQAIEKEKEDRIKAAKEALADELKGIEEKKQAYLKENAENAQAERAAAAERVKEIESNLASNEGYEPGRNGTIRKKRKKDISQDFSSADLAQDWNGENSKIGEIKKDLQGIIQLSDQANSHINNFLKVAIPARTELKNGSFTVDQNEWDKWSEKGIKAINIAKQELSQLKDIGAITSEEYEKYTYQLNDFITEEGKISKNKDAKELQVLFENIQTKAQSTGEELKKIFNILKQSADQINDLTDEQKKEIEKKSKEAEDKNRKAAEDAEKTATNKNKKNDDATINAEKEKVEQDIKNTIEETNKKREEVNQKEKENLEIIKNSEEAQESINKAIDARGERIEEENKQYQKQASIEGVMNIGGAIMGLANMNQQLENLSKSFVKGEASISSFIGSLTSATLSGISGFEQLQSAAANLSKSSVKAISGIGKALDSLSLPLTILSVGVGIVKSLTGAINEAKREAYEANYELISNQVDEQKQLVESANNELDAINDLYKGYTDLAKQRGNNTSFTDDQKEVINELVEKYDDEHLKVLLLVEDYEKLEEAIRNARLEKLKETAEEEKRYYNDVTEKFEAAVLKNDGSDFGVNMALAAMLKEYGVEYSDVSDDISTNLKLLLEKSGDDIESNIDKLKEAFPDYIDLLNEIERAYKASDQSNLNTILLENFDPKSIDTAEKYEETLEKISNFELPNGQKVGKDRAKEFLDGFVAGAEEYATQTNLKEEILGLLGLNKEQSQTEVKEEGNKIGSMLAQGVVKGYEDILKVYGFGGNVDLTNRPVIDTAELASWGEEPGGVATVFSSTFSNEDGTKAINFTPIMVDENGEFIGVLSPDELQEYAENVINGAKDDKHLQIGLPFFGEDAIEQAEKIAEIIHNIHQFLYPQSQDNENNFLGQFEQEYDTYTQDQKDFLYSHYQLAADMQNLDEFWKFYSARKSTQETISLVGGQLNKKESDFNKKENIDALYNDEYFTSNFEYSREDFEQLSFQEKMDALSEFYDFLYSKEMEFQESEKNGIDKAVEEQKKALDEQRIEFDQVIGDFKNDVVEEYGDLGQLIIDKVLSNGDYLAVYEKIINGEALNFKDKIKQGLITNFLGGEDNFDDSINIVKDYQDATKDFSDELKSTTQITNEFEESQKELEDILSNNEAATFSFKEKIEGTKNAIKDLNTSIDDIQSSYQALQSIVEDYNEDGALTLDNVQKLMEMDTAYVATLDLQNDKLVLNDEAYKNLMEAQAQQMRLRATELFLDELHAIANDEVADSATRMMAAEYANAEALGVLESASDRTRESLLRLDAVQAAMGHDKGATENAMQGYLNRLKMIDNVAKQPISSMLGKTSSSKGSSSKPKEEKYLEREEDIYHQINQELEQIESTLGRIQKLEDHSWGASAKANLEEENKLLEKQIEKLHEKKALQERDLSTRRKQLEDVGISFTEDGSAMTNAEAQLNALYAHYNTMVDTYNAMSAAEQETYKKQLDAEKDRIKKIEDKIKDYESTFSDYQSVLDEIMDKHFEQIEKQVKTFNNDIEVHLELDKAKEEWNDFWYDVVKDVEDTDFAGQISKSIDALKILIGTTTNFVDSQVYVLTNHLNDTIAEVRAQIASASRGGADSMFGDDSALSKETLKDYRDKLMEALTTAKGKLDDFSDNYLKMLDAAQEKIDEQVSGWESISSHLEHNAKLIQMISGENSYEALNEVYEQQYKNNLNLIETQRTSKEFWQREMAAAQARMATVDKDSKAYKTYAEDYKKASENYKKAVADLDKTVEEALEDLETWKKNQLDAINHAFDMALSNNVGLEMMEKEWKLVNEQADRYLDNVERALGMEDLNNEFNKVLDTAGLSIKAQQELNRMRDEEIAKLNQKAKISQFDLDEIKARLEIRKQEIALEEAQRNKSNLRLRRDSQGNYTYQYTGDDSKIEEASEGLMSAKREWYELVKKRNIDLSNSILENRKNLQQELQNLETMYFENDEEKRAAQNEIIQRYADIEKDIMADKEEAKKIFFQGTAEYFSDVENNTILPQWQTTVESLVDAWSNGGEDSFIGAVEAGINKIDSVQQQYVDNTHQILNQAGMDYLNMKENGIDPTIESLEELVETNEDLADTLENTSSLLEDQARALEECEDGYNRLKDAAVDAVREAEATLEQLSQTVIRTNQQVQASIESAKNATSLWNTVNSSTNPNSPSNSSNNYLPSQTSSTDNQLKYVVYRNNTNGSVDSSPRTYTNKTDVKKFILDALQHYLMGTVRIYSGNSLVRTLHYGGTYGSREMAYLKSGGYTGTWSGSNHIDDLKSGKLAVLHQKELVLNETDTSNVLDAVHLLRSISVDKIAESIINAARTSASVLNGVGAGMMQGITNLVQNSQANDNSYRNTTINADFSGVRSADAIYQALMELENYNMQQSFT